MSCRLSGSIRIVVAFTVAAFGLLISSAQAQSYKVERIASGLAQPTYVTQAPGDPANIIYYSTRITANPGTGGGFGAVNQMGGIFRYDMNTRVSTKVMDLSYRNLTGDEGLVGFAFSPDFNTPGSPGYQKFYVSSSQNTSPATERVEEYVASGPNGTVPLDGNNRATVNRLVLQYQNIRTDPNHTIDWIGFDPTAPAGSAARNYLYVVAGDGAIGSDAQTRPEQKSSSLLGKILRVDVDTTHGDAYPSDNNKNFAIPATNPIPLWNANHPSNQQLAGTHINFATNPVTSADYSPALPEIYATGTRNSFRSSIDRQTGDLWMGDVGENSREEVNFLKAGTYNGTQPPLDFGYASREGTIPTMAGTLAVANSSGSTQLIWNLSGGGTTTINSVNPIQEGSHDAGRSSYIGGYVYRGPIAELQGKYFYADFVKSNIFQLDGFDRNTPLSSYSGTNFNLGSNGLASIGTVTPVATANLSSLWNQLIFDPADPTYTSLLGPNFGIGRVVSFGEDNSGNLYIVDFGGTRGDTSFAADYPNAGRGQIFMLVPVPEPATVVLVLCAAPLALIRSRMKPASKQN
jgi:glucose/arabinose dehydrogenase